MDKLAYVSDYLSTYGGRDKFLRTLSYAAKLASGMPASEETAAKFRKFGSEMSGCRTILRLLDDLPAWNEALSYDWKKKEANLFIKWVNITQVVIDLIYSPIESIAWAGEQKFISINTETWNNATIWLWILSINLSMTKTLYNIKQLKVHKLCLHNAKSDTGIASNKVTDQQRNEILTFIRLILDFSYAVNYLPAGRFWGGKLKTWQVGALGTISSLLGIYQALNNKRMKQLKVC